MTKVFMKFMVKFLINFYIEELIKIDSPIWIVKKEYLSYAKINDFDFPLIVLQLLLRTWKKFNDEEDDRTRSSSFRQRKTNN